MNNGEAKTGLCPAAVRRTGARRITSEMYDKKVNEYKEEQSRTC